MLVLNNVEVIYDKVFLAIKGVSIEAGPAAWPLCSAATERARAPR